MSEIGAQFRDLLATRQNRLASFLIVVLVLAGIYLTYTYWQTRDEGLWEPKPSPADQLTEPGAIGAEEGTYLVQPGDTLWTIAEEKLGDGFRWSEIAELNGLPLENPRLEIGQQLRLPVERDLAQFLGDEEPTPEPTIEPVIIVQDEVLNEEGELNGEGVSIGGPGGTPATAIGGEYYTVQRGDSLWSIANNYYGDGGLWHEIYAANRLSMYQAPSGSIYPLIHAGNVLYLPEVGV